MTASDNLQYYLSERKEVWLGLEVVINDELELRAAVNETSNVKAIA